MSEFDRSKALVQVLPVLTKDQLEATKQSLRRELILFTLALIIPFVHQYAKPVVKGNRDELRMIARELRRRSRAAQLNNEA